MSKVVSPVNTISPESSTNALSTQRNQEVTINASSNPSINSLPTTSTNLEASSPLEKLTNTAISAASNSNKIFEDLTLRLSNDLSPTNITKSESCENLSYQMSETESFGGLSNLNEKHKSTSESILKEALANSNSLFELCNELNREESSFDFGKESLEELFIEGAFKNKLF